jgi:hypothetical protein
MQLNYQPRWAKEQIMTTTLDDFFGDSSENNVPKCSFCSGIDGDLIVSVKDAYGPTHWHHAACKEADGAKKGIIQRPTWDETMDEDQAEFYAEMQAEADSGLPQLCGYCGGLSQDCECNV